MNRVTQLFNIRYPIVQAGMVWCSGWRLASAVSNAGGLGLIGSGSMEPEVLRHHIRRCRQATPNPFGVNVPLLYKHTPEIIRIIIEENVKIVFTSAGNPATYTGLLKDSKITVAHVVANSRFARKAEDAGADAIVAEGFEAGGHNGREETTTLCLLPLVRQAVKLPLLAAGGIASGKAMLAAIVLGADGVQAGSVFAAAEESSAHVAFKHAIVEAGEGDTKLTMKTLIPVRLLKNEFYKQIEQAEAAGAGRDQLMQLLGRQRAKQGMFEGDVHEGELEIGQVSAMINEVKPAKTILDTLWAEFVEEKERLGRMAI